MSLEDVEELACGVVPELDGVVEAGGGQRLAVGAEGDAHDDAFMPLDLGGGLGEGEGREGERGARHQSDESLHRKGSPIVAWSRGTKGAGQG